MPLLIPLNYNKLHYPEHISSKIYEIPCHFDVDSIPSHSSYSLHTEYSYGPRNFDKLNVNYFPSLINAQYKGIPTLWASKEWALDFAAYILLMTHGKAEPQIIEVHPPFSDYANMHEFLENFRYFEDAVKSEYANVEILIENRSGTRYGRSDFLISTIDHIVQLCETLETYDINLQIALDLPQLFTAHHIEIPDSSQIAGILNPILDFREKIKGIHLWGKKIGKAGKRVAHAGDLNSLFGYNDELKQVFLSRLANCFNDGNTRYFVPEVNSGTTDLRSIICDIEAAGFHFI